MAIEPRTRIARVAAGSAMLAVSYAEVRRSEISVYEEWLFRAANDADDRLRVPVRAVMQAGTFITVPAVAVVAFVTGRRAVALRVLAALGPAGRSPRGRVGAGAPAPAAGTGRLRGGRTGAGPGRRDGAAAGRP